MTYSQLIALINAQIKANAQNEITGTILNNVLTKVTDYSKENFDDVNTALGTKLTTGNIPTINGSNNYVFFNDQGVLGGNSDFSYDKITKALRLTDVDDCTRINSGGTSRNGRVILIGGSEGLGEDGTVIIGTFSQALGGNDSYFNTIIGYGARIDGDKFRNVVIGAYATTNNTASRAIVVGSGSKVTGGSIVIGTELEVLGTDSASFNGGNVPGNNIFSYGGVDTRHGFGLQNPTAKIHIRPGTATIPSFRIDPGVLNTTPQLGAVEYDGTNLFFIRTGSTRESFITANAVNSVSLSSPNRTITVVIDGTTYYLSAKTTND